MKKQGHNLADFKPTPNHWSSFATAVIKLRVFDEIMELAAQQAIIQFADSLQIMNVEDSSDAAKEEAVFNLIYMNLLRIAFGQMITSTESPIVPIDFFNKMSRVSNADEMEDFVKNEFIPVVRSPKTLGINFPRYRGSYDATSNLQKFLLKKVNKN